MLLAGASGIPRRSDTIRSTRREPIPWSSDAEFRILSIDGVGIRGIFPAAILAWLEEYCLAGGRIGDYFDLIAGTSTGGVIALGLGAGLSASEVLELYLCRGHLVFPPQQRTRAGRLWNRLFRNRYERRPLDELLRRELGTSRLLDSRYRLLIPATEGRGDPYVYKTPHHPSYFLDGENLMRDVAAATSAAPTFFRPVVNDGYVLLDGGVWANNPAMLALVEALSCFAVDRSQIRILSLGCGGDGFQINDRQLSGAGQLFWKDIFFVAMHYQSLTAINQAGLLIGRDNVVRLDRPSGAVPIELDDWGASARTLPVEARAVAEEAASQLKEKFFHTRAGVYAPLS